MSVILSIMFGKTIEERTRKMRFNLTNTIHDIIIEIKNKDDIKDIENYALFFPDAETDFKTEKRVYSGTGQWMIPSKTIESYNLTTDTKIWFRPRFNVINLKYSGTLKKMNMDVACSVKELIINICDKLSLTHPEAFALMNDRTKRWIPKQHPLYKTCKDDDVIEFKKRHFINGGELTRDDPLSIYLSYSQAQENIVGGFYPCNKDEAVMFATLQMIIDNRTYDPEVHKLSSVRSEVLCPPQWRSKAIEKEIFNNYKDQSPMSVTDAQYKYLQLCNTLRAYGMNIYNGGVEPEGYKHVEGKKRKSNPALLAFSPTQIKLLTPEHKEILVEPYEHLKNWVFKPDYIDLNFGDYNNGKILRFVTNQGADISSLIAGYLDIIIKKAAKKVEIQDTTAAATEVQMTNKKKLANIKKKAIQASVVAEPQQMLVTQVEKYGAEYEVTKGFALPIMSGVSIEKRSGRTDDDWRNTLRTRADDMLGLMDPLVESIRGKNKKLEAERVKKFGFVVEALRNEVLAIQATLENDEPLIETCNNLMEAICEYMDACAAFSADPDNEQLIYELNKAAAHVNICATALCASGAKRNDKNDEFVMHELSSTIQMLIEEACETGIEVTQNKQATDLAVRKLRIDGEQCSFSIDNVGMFLQDPFAKRLMDSTLVNVDSDSQKLAESCPGNNELDFKLHELATECLLVQEYIEEMSMDPVSKKRLFLESIASTYHAATWLSELENIVVDNVQTCSVTMKNDLPVIMKYLKSQLEDPEIEDSKRAFIIQNLKDITTEAKTILMNADQNVFEEDNVDEIKESAAILASKIESILGEDLSQMHEASLYCNAKKAAASTMKLANKARNLAKEPQNKEYEELLQNNVKNMSGSVKSLLRELKESRKDEVEVVDFINAAYKYKDDIYTKDFSKLYDDINGLSVGSVEMKELKSELDFYLNALQADAESYKKAEMLEAMSIAEQPCIQAEAELRHCMLLAEADLLEAEGIKEELAAIALEDLSDLIASAKLLPEQIQPYEKESRENMNKFSAKSKKTLKAVVKASKTGSKNERKLLLEAAQKFANEVTKLLKAADDKSIGRDEGDTKLNFAINNVELIGNDLEKILSVMKADEDFEVEIKEEKPANIELEKKAVEKIKGVKERLDNIQNELIEKNNIRKAEMDQNDPKEVLEVALNEAVIAMVSSTCGVLVNAQQAQEELVALLENPETAKTANRGPEYAEELIASVAEVDTNLTVMQAQINDDSVSTNEVVKTADKVSKSVERVVISCRAGVKAKKSSNRHKELLAATKKLASATTDLLEAAKKVDELDDTPIAAAVVVVQPQLPPVIEPQVVVVEEVEEDFETYGIDEYTLREIEQQKKIFNLEKKLEAAKRKKAKLEELAKEKNF